MHVDYVLSPHASLAQNWINWFKGYMLEGVRFS